MLSLKKTNISNDSTVTIQCVNKKVTDVSEKDAKELYNMLNDKEVHYDSDLACPFRDDFCITFNGGISGEGCGSIKYRKSIFLYQISKQKIKKYLE